MAGTFSAAALVALGGGGARPEVQVAKDQLREAKEAKKFIADSKRLLEDVKRNTARFVARAGK